MSSLQKNLLKSKLPPRCPRSSGPKMAPFGGRSRDYTPISWKQYFTCHHDVETNNGTFRVYLTEDPDNANRPRVVTLHGGGYSALSWSLFAKELISLINCQVISIDLRGHGETQTKEPDNMSAESLVTDMKDVIFKLFENNESPIPPIILIGHSMGGAIAVRVAALPELEAIVAGLVVIDVVEGTALDSLTSMQGILRSRPTHFKSIEHAIEWCVRSGQVRNIESARVSMPSQIVNCETNTLAIREVDTYEPSGNVSPPHHERMPAHDSIMEEGSEATNEPFVVPQPSVEAENQHKYKWRIDLSKTEPFWRGWFENLSRLFLSVRAPKMLLLASIDGLDRELTVGQMQGKFQMRVLTRCGHAVHEDRPEEVASALASFMLRQQLTTATENGSHVQLFSSPGC